MAWSLIVSHGKSVVLGALTVIIAFSHIRVLVYNCVPRITSPKLGPPSRIREGAEFGIVHCTANHSFRNSSFISNFLRLQQSLFSRNVFILAHDISTTIAHSPKLLKLFGDFLVIKLINYNNSAGVVPVTINFAGNILMALSL